MSTVTKTEAEQAFRQLFAVWARDDAQTATGANERDFSAFRDWVQENGYGHFFRFRSVRGATSDVEDWFDRWFGQTWRN